MRPFLVLCWLAALPLTACFASPPASSVTLSDVSAHPGRALLPVLRSGDVLRLSAEPDHPFDPEAVAAYWGDFKLGYLPAERPCRRCEQAAVRVRAVRGDAVDVELLGWRPESKPPQVRRVALAPADGRGWVALGR